MRLFVTGATGFIGSHFVNAAHAAGHEIVALRRSPNSTPRVLLQTEPTWLDKGMDQVVASDFSGCQEVIHLAAHTPNVPYDTLENCLHWNVIVPLALFRAAVSSGIDRFVVAGSCFEYGRSGENYEFIPPDAPLQPTQTYPASKAAASIAFCQFAMERSLRLSLHRIFQVFGEGEAESRLWPSLRRAASTGEDMELTPAEQIRDFVSVEEVARQLLEALDWNVEPAIPKIVNIGSGEARSLRTFAESWWSKWGATGRLHFGAKPYRAGEVMRYVPAVASVVLR